MKTSQDNDDQERVKMSKANLYTAKKLEPEIINKEQEKVIVKLEEVLSFLKSVHIKNEEALDNIKKPLEELQSSLKYLPIDQSFDILPVELKTGILNHLCDTQAFTVASVCQEWKKILATKFEGGKVIIGKHCKECTDNECCKPEEMLKASEVLSLDVDLSLCHPVTEIEPKVITDGLLSGSSFTVTEDCECVTHDVVCGNPILSFDQWEHLFRGLEKKKTPMEKVELVCLNLTELNQERLADCLVTKVKKLKINYVSDHVMVLKTVDLKTLLSKLLQDTVNGKPVKMDSLILEGNYNCVSDFRALLAPEDIRILFSKMTTLQLKGEFLEEQLEVARSFSDVSVRGIYDNFNCIRKGPDKEF